MGRDIEHVEFELLSLKRIHDSVNQRVSFLEIENNNLKLQINNNSKEMSIFTSMKNLQDKMIQQTITNQNIINSQNLELIDSLTKENLTLKREIELNGN